MVIQRNHLLIIKFDPKVISWVISHNDPLKSIDFSEMFVANHTVHNLTSLLAVDFDVFIIKGLRLCPTIRAFVILNPFSD